MSASLSDDEVNAWRHRRTHQLLERWGLLDLERHVRGELVDDFGSHLHLVERSRHVEEIEHDANTGVAPLERHDPSHELLDHRVEAAAMALAVRLSVQVEPGCQLREVVEEPHLCGHRPSHANFAVAPIGDEVIECIPAAAPVSTKARPVRISSHVVLAQNCATRSRAPSSGIWIRRCQIPSYNVWIPCRTEYER